MIYVLSGTLVKKNGTYPEGSYIYNPPGSWHQTSSPDGCTLLITWFGKVKIPHGAHASH